MVRAAGEIDPEPMVQGVARRLDGPLDGVERALAELGTPGKAQPPHLGRRERSFEYRVHVPRRVHELERPAVRAVGLLDRVGGQQSSRDDLLAETGVLGDGESMAVGQGDREPGGRPRAHGQSRTARASATFRTAASSSGVNGSGTSLSTSICPRIVAPRRISTTSSERVHVLQAM